MCVSETYLDSSISIDEKDIAIKGYSLVWQTTQVTQNKESVFIIKNH